MIHAYTPSTPKDYVSLIDFSSQSRIQELQRQLAITQAKNQSLESELSKLTNRYQNQDIPCATAETTYQSIFSQEDLRNGESLPNTQKPPRMDQLVSLPCKIKGKRRVFVCVTF